MNSHFSRVCVAAACVTLLGTALAAEPPAKHNTAPAAAPRSATELVTAKVKVPQLKRQPSLQASASVRLFAPHVATVDSAPGKGGASAAGLNRSLAVSATLGVQTPVKSGAVVVSPNATGPYGPNFTSSRVAPAALDVSYPTRTVGKLYFNDGMYWYMCTASLIKPGIAVTAGHCVHDGSGADTGFYRDFEFIPGYRRVASTITQPYGSWTNWAAVYTSPSWYSGAGQVPNAQDWALIVFNPDASGHRVGDYTGWLGYATDMGAGLQTTVLGYPYNLSSGGQLQRVDSTNLDDDLLFNQDYNNGFWGSDMEGGSSGGPVVMNWRVAYTDSTGARPMHNAANRVVSVVSWGFDDATVEIQGGALFNADFDALVQTACTKYPGAC
jgi:V8-like Glu-specific endopeptidase